MLINRSKIHPFTQNLIDKVWLTDDSEKERKPKKMSCPPPTKTDTHPTCDICVVE